MNLKELLDLHRAHYLDHFIAGARKFPDGVTEMLMELDFPAPDEIYRHYRIDMATQHREQFKFAEFTLDKPFLHAPFVEQRGSAVVEVQPFPWNKCVVEVLTDRIDRGAVIAWATHWIDVEDLRPHDADGLLGVIHNITPPSYPGGKLTYVVDFGTAPVQAVLELIQVLTVGAKSAKVTLSAISVYAEDGE